MLVTILIVLALIFFITVAVKIKSKIDDGEKRLTEGKIKFYQYNTPIVRLFAASKLDESRRKISAGEEKLSKWTAIFYALVALSILCVVIVIKRILAK